MKAGSKEFASLQREWYEKLITGCGMKRSDVYEQENREGQWCEETAKDFAYRRVFYWRATKEDFATKNGDLAKNRECWKLYYIDDLTIKQIAGRLNNNFQNVWRKLNTLEQRYLKAKHDGRLEAEYDSDAEYDQFRIMRRKLIGIIHDKSPHATWREITNRADYLLQSGGFRKLLPVEEIKPEPTQACVEQNAYI
ncbi:MAG: hypothetical protein ACOH5I_21955 [Oligoflexus sp.]